MAFAKFVKKAFDEKKIGIGDASRMIGVGVFFSKILAGKMSPPSEERVIKNLQKSYLAVEKYELAKKRGAVASTETKPVEALEKSVASPEFTEELL